MFRLTIKSLAAHKVRFALTALAVMLGVAFMAGTLVLTDTVKQTFDDLFADINEGTDAYLRSKDVVESQFGDQRARIPAALLSEVQGVDGVAGADGIIQFYAQPVAADGDAIGNPGRGAPTFGLNWSETPELNTFTLVDYDGVRSRRPTTGDEVVLDKGSTEDGGFRIGDEVTILTQGAPQTFTLVGVVKFGENDSPAGAAVSIFTTERAEELAGAVGQLDAIAAAGEDGVTQGELVRRIRVAIDDPGVEVLTGEQITEENQSDIQQSLSFFNTALLIFAGIALFVGGFIILNTFRIVVAQRTRELALLRALGASTGQVARSVIGEAVVVGVLASIVGLVAGVFLSIGLKGILAAFGIDIPAGPPVLLAGSLLTAFLVGVVLTLLVSIFPAVKAGRVPPIAALRDVAIERTKGFGVRTIIGLVFLVPGLAFVVIGVSSDDGVQAFGLGALLTLVGVIILAAVIAKPASRLIGAPLPRLRGITGGLARENAMRNPRRTALTALALMISVTLVSFITVFAASAKASIGEQVDAAFRADFVIAPKGAAFGGGFSPDLVTQVAALPEVEAAGGLKFNQVEIDGSGQFIAASDPATINTLFDLEPRQGELADLGPDDIAVSETVMQDKGWQVGDRIPTRFPIGGDQELTITATYGRGQAEGLTDYFISDAAFAKRFSEQLDFNAFVTLADGVTADEGERAIAPIIAQYPTVELQNQAEYKEQQEASINQFLGLIYVMLFLAVVIALIGIVNTLALSIVERTRELGLLRAVGMTRAQLRSSVRWESAIIAVFGTVLGIVLGVFFSWAVVRSLAGEGFTNFQAPVTQLAVIVVLAAIAAVLAAVWPAWRASKLDILDAVGAE